MTQEEKDILLKELSVRSHYGVKVCARFNTGNRYTTNVTAICTDRDYIETRQNALHSYTGSSVEDIRPYLRPMSNMTEEERSEYHKACTEVLLMRYRASSHYPVTDWLNAHHFDYRGLIEKGLALEAPEDMYKME